MNYIESISDKQLVRLYNRILDKIRQAFTGGTQFGVDIPTLRMCEPGLYSAYVIVKNEGKRRL